MSTKLVCNPSVAIKEYGPPLTVPRKTLYPAGVPVEAFHEREIFEPLAVAVKPVGVAGIEMAFVPVQVIWSVAFTVPVSVSVPVRNTAAVGAHLTVAVQVAPGTIVEPLLQVVEGKERSVPLTVVAADNTSFAEPLLVQVTAIEELALTFTFPKATGFGLQLITGAAAPSNG